MGHDTDEMDLEQRSFFSMNQDGPLMPKIYQKLPWAWKINSSKLSSFFPIFVECAGFC